jgi:hypothetical protein
MLYILGPGATLAQSLNEDIVGTFKAKLIEILSSDGSDRIVEMDSDEYDVLKPTLIKCDIDFRVVTGVPDVPTPRSFLFELDGNYVIAYSSLELKPPEEEKKFLDKFNLDESDEVLSNEES